MLTKFRKGADNVFVRILLGFIAVSFVGVGAASFLNGNSRGDVITFSKAKPISFETFAAIKATKIEHIQRENNINLTEQQIKELNIDHKILQELVNDSMISYLATIYDFDISENLVINFVKKMPYFHDEDGKFDLNTFKSSFRNSQRREDEYLTNLKTSLIKGTLLDIFRDSFKPSKIMVNNVVDYMAETKYFDLVSIDLTHKYTDFKNDQIEPQELENFYKNNENDFVLPELRSFDYVSIDKDFFSKKIKIDENDAKIYYDENKNDFEDKPYSAVKKQVHNILFTAKLEELIAELARSLEEDVAAGVNLKDIGAKYNAKIFSVTNISQNGLNNDKKLKLENIGDSVFEMVENEISYPMELPDQQKIILVELKDITPSRKQNFEEVKGQIYSILQSKAVMHANTKILEEFRNNYNPSNLDLESLKRKGISVENNQSVTRADLQLEEKINPELAYLILNTPKNQFTKLVGDNKRAYFAFVKNETINKEKAKKIIDTSSGQIINAIKEGVMQELIGYLTEQNDMKVKL